LTKEINVIIITAGDKDLAALFERRGAGERKI
jgi:hypothetical protein